MPYMRKKIGICSDTYKNRHLGWDIQGSIISGELLHLQMLGEKHL
jgi:hypothetical protein